MAGDREVSRLLNLATRNWEAAKNRIEQMAQEREEGIDDDNSVEMIPIFVRMERVYNYLFSLLRHPQAYLLPSVINGLRPFISECAMDAELVRLMINPAEEIEEETPYFWTTLLESPTDDTSLHPKVYEMLTNLILKYVAKHLDTEGMTELVKVLSDMPAALDNGNVELPPEMGLFDTGKKLVDAANSYRLQMAIGLLMRHTFIEHICDKLDIQKLEDTDVDNIFEKAKQQLMESDAWREFWADHKQHLERKGPLDEQWKQDAQETEQWLHDVHGYLYEKWNESPEVFGQALKREQLDDDKMLLLLFYLAKKDAIALETEQSDVRREKMECNAFETAMKLYEFADDNYLKNYEKIWLKIVRSENLASQLMDYNSSKYNNGFNMMCLCKIVAYLQREHHFYGSHSPADMGKVLGDRYVKNSYNTFSDYIKKKETMLNEQCFKELEEILKNFKKENSKK